MSRYTYERPFILDDNDTIVCMVVSRLNEDRYTLNARAARVIRVLDLADALNVVGDDRTADILNIVAAYKAGE